MTDEALNNVTGVLILYQYYVIYRKMSGNEMQKKGVQSLSVVTLQALIRCIQGTI